MEALDVQVAVAKAGKYASRESGDTVEIVERPHGGLSAVVADGQQSGYSAKAISNAVVRKAISLLADGVRDGAVARATHDYLLTYRGGKVSAELMIVSIDLVTATLVISRNARCPSLVRAGSAITWLDTPAEAIGTKRNTKPAITELPLAAHVTVVIFTDGVWRAGAQPGAEDGAAIDLPGLLAQVDGDGCAPAQVVADAVLDRALTLEKGRARDDATVLVVKLLPRPPASAQDTVFGAVRRMAVQFPV